MNRKLLSFVGGILLSAVSSAFAGYTITRTDGRPLNLVQGRDYQLQIVSSPALFDNVFLQTSGALASCDIFVGNGVQVGPNEYKVDATGKLIFTIRFHQAPGNVNLTVTNKNDPSIFTTVSASLQRYPTTFQITPTIPSITANTSYTIQITPLDANGIFVSYFEDPVQIVDSSALGILTPVDGNAFVTGNGIATAIVTTKAGDMNNKVSLTISGLTGFNVPGPVPAPTYTSPLFNLTPGAYSKVTMLFPGETLTPGIGKSGTVGTQVAAVPVGLVTIWPVDAFYNPIYSAVSLSMGFTSSEPTDTVAPSYLPPTQSLTTPPLQIAGGQPAPNRFVFNTNGTRTITATPNGQSAQADQSVVPVAPGATNTYAFTVQPNPGQIFTTDDVITIQIEARSGGILLTSLYGALPGAKLSARISGPPVQENVLWADTNPSTIVPDNVVNFVAGIATVNLNVTKRSQVVDLHFEDQFGVGTYSNQFEVRTGALSKVHMTILGKPGVLVGETFTPGTYPGNSGTPPTIVAGDQLVVEARLTDAHWNVVTGPAITGTPITLSSLVPSSYITATHPADPTVTFPIGGELTYQTPPFDTSFRVSMRTAGLNKQFRATTNFSPQDFLSSTVTVSAGAYNRVAFEAPGETLRPGSFFANGKEGVPSTQGAGIAFNMTAYLTDQYWNPLQNPPYANTRFSITPSNAASFISGITLGQSVSMAASNRTVSVSLGENSAVRVEDAGNANLFQSVSIPVGPGNVDHFRFTLASNTDKEAGVPFNVLIQAEDQFNQIINNFNNSINLSATTGVGTMSPATVSMSGGIYNGPITCFAANNAVKIVMQWGGTTSTSNSFKVLPNSLGYKKLLLLGPDEVAAPGTTWGKTGANAPRSVGTAITVRAVACDQYFNQLTTISSQKVAFASDSYAQFSPAQGDLALGEFSTTLVLKAAVIHTLTATDITAGGVTASSSTIQGLAGPYSRLQIIAPGELPDPGNEATGGKKAGFPPSDQMVSVANTVTILSVDNYYNPVQFSGGDVLFVSSPTNTIYLPPNNTQNGPTPRTIQTGTHTRSVLFGSEGFYTLKALDQNDLTKTFGQVTIHVVPGPTYNIQSPATAVAGSNFGAVTISLQMNGIPVNGYSQTVFLSAVLPDGTPATGQFTPDGSERQFVTNNGVVVINDLNYQYVEGIKIKVRDNFGRIAFSNLIDVQPSGLKYTVSVPATGIVGPPSTFRARIELRDRSTDTLIKSPLYNHTVGLEATSLLFPTADGTLSVSSASLVNGICAIDVAYTKAEAIVLKASNLNLAGWTIVPRNSNAITLSPDSYKKLIIIAPGETHTPGVTANPTGKTGTPNQQDRKLSVVFQVKGTDQFANTVDSFNGGKIHFESTDALAFLNAPVPQDAPLAGGQTATAITFNKAGTIPVIVRDDNNGTIVSQKVDVPVIGTFFDIAVPATQFTGQAFSMTISLRNSAGAVVPAFGPITIEALQVDGSKATGTLDVTSANLVAGNVTITNQRYTIAEGIRLRVKDLTGDNESVSNVISFIPRAVTYQFRDIPAESEVNKLFNFTIQAIDSDTGTEIKNMNRTGLPLEAFVSVSGLPAGGTFVPNLVNVVNGKITVSATYNRAETIYLRLADNTTVFDPPPVPTQQYYFSGAAIKINPGALVTVDVKDPIQFLAGTSDDETLTFKDTFGNLIPNQKVSLSADIPGQLRMNSESNELVALTDANGELKVTFSALPNANGLITVRILDLDRPNRGFAKEFKVNILGINGGPGRALTLGGNRIPVNTPWFIDLTGLQVSAGGVVSTYYSLDGGPYQTYNPSSGATGFSTTKTYDFRWYSDVCYPNVDPTCVNKVSELVTNGGPHTLDILTYQLSDKLVGYPSPFNPKSSNGDNFITIQYPLASASSVDVDIYDLFGQKVWHQTIDAGQQGGEARTDNRVIWRGINDDGTTVANGGYVVVVKVGATGQRMKTKILVAK